MGLLNVVILFGIKVMEEMDRFNDEKGIVLNDMVFFLVLNVVCI